MERDPLTGHDVARVRAENPGPMTLSGTKTWVVGRDPSWVVDPGPAIAEHVEAVAAEAKARGGLGGIALTHGHADHVDAIAPLRERAGAVAVMGAAEQADIRISDGDLAGPLQAVAAPGHSADHLAYIAGRVCFTGDAVLGEGSVFVSPDPGALAGYLEALRRLRGMPLEVLCPGHGPPVGDPAAKLDEYLAHRLDRERRLLEALAEGLRDEEDLLDTVWDDVPRELRPAAAVTLRAHLHKLREDGRLPGDVRIA